jgi:hypothetical protein
MSTEQDPRYAGYVQRKTAEGKEPEGYDDWKARIDGLDKARAAKAGQAPPNPDDSSDDTALDAAAEMATIAEQKMALVNAKEAELEERERRLEEQLQAGREQVAATNVELAEADLAVSEDPTVNASALGAATHVQAEMPVRMKPQSIDDYPEDAVLHFSCPYNRNRVEVMQAGQKTVINNQIVVLSHKTIEFSEHHWSADLSDPDMRERAAWLLQSKAFRAGEIVLVPTVQVTPAKVRTGPRTAGLQPAKIERPAGPLSVTVGAN